MMLHEESTPGTGPSVKSAGVPRRAVLGAVGAGAVLSACSAGGGDEGAAGTTELRLGILNEVQSWDPSQAHVGHLLQPYQAPYDTLLLRNPEGELEPMLATEWSYDETNTVLTLKLRDDVTFSDGAAFDAAAVVANFENFRAGNGRQAAQLAAYASSEAVDATTVRLTLSAPDPSMEYYLSQAAGLMGSPASLGTDEIDGNPVGTGPYVMDSARTVAGSQYVFTAREGYWNPDLQKFSSLTLRVLTDVTARLNALLSGQLDGTLLDARTAPQAEKAGKELFENQVDWAGLLLLDRDGRMVPGLADVRVRQAINSAIDRETLLEQVQLGNGEVTQQPFGPPSGAFLDELDSTYTYDPDAARALMDEAGFGDGFDLNLPSLPDYEAVLAAISQQLGEIGIRVSITSVPPVNYVTDVVAAKYPAFFFNLFQGQPWTVVNQIISTDALYNPFDTTNPDIQALIDAVHFGGDQAADLAAEVNRYVVENAWFVPIYRPNQMYFCDPAKITVVPQIQQAVPSIHNFSPANG